MNLDDWITNFHPIENPTGQGFEIDDRNFMLETYGSEFEQVRRANREDPLKVWTLVEANDEQFIVEGLRRVNRIGYFVTQKSRPQMEFEIPFK